MHDRVPASQPDCLPNGFLIAAIHQTTGWRYRFMPDRLHTQIKWSSERRGTSVFPLKEKMFVVAVHTIGLLSSRHLFSIDPMMTEFDVDFFIVISSSSLSVPYHHHRRQSDMIIRQTSRTPKSFIEHNTCEKLTKFSFFSCLQNYENSLPNLTGF